jgi:hypothetical protein
MNIGKNPSKNNFASAPAFPIIEATAYRGDLRLFDENNLPPDYGPLSLSLVTKKQMKKLQDFMEENFVDGLAMLNPDFARTPNEFLFWNDETGRYDFDMVRFDARAFGHE